jgi:hypothetical protein
MRRLTLMLLVLAVCAGCGGSDRDDPSDAGGRPAVATTHDGETTTGPPSLGCDTLPVCFPEFADAALAACGERPLSGDASHAREALERFVEDGVDYMDSEQYNAATDALTAVEEACF